MCARGGVGGVGGGGAGVTSSRRGSCDEREDGRGIGRKWEGGKVAMLADLHGQQGRKSREELERERECV